MLLSEESVTGETQKSQSACCEKSFCVARNDLNKLSLQENAEMELLPVGEGVGEGLLSDDQINN